MHGIASKAPLSGPGALPDVVSCLLCLEDFRRGELGP